MSSLTDAFDALGRVVRASATPPRTLPDRPDVAVTGRSDNNAVTAHLTRGRVTRVDLREHVLTRDPDDIADMVLTAVNNALDAHDRAVVADLQAQERTDLMQLSNQLDTIGRDAQRSLDTYMSTMEDLLRRATKEARS